MLRSLVVVFLTLVASLVLFGTAGVAQRQFPETGYSVTNSKFLDYFDHRGGVSTFGLPISREFDLLGTRVQFFQRAVMQQRPDGSVALLNILDTGLLPYSRINGSTFPDIDTSIASTAPSVSDANYATRALDFVRAYAPDSWQGMNTNFFTKFANTVSYENAFPNGGADPGLLPLINLEIWGFPTSKPTSDPNNGNFVYLRFQRGIMHYDRTTGVTQGILIGEYLKSVITGQSLPIDLDQQAAGSKLYKQYNNNDLQGLTRAADLPGTNMFAAFEKDGVVVATPNPTATPIPATATPVATATPTAVATPSAITVTADAEWVTTNFNNAVTVLKDNDAIGYDTVLRAYVFTIQQGATSSIDYANRKLIIAEGDALPSNWRGNTDAQARWLAGWLIHAGTHIEQYHAGRAYTGATAESEALQRQRASVSRYDNTTNQQFLSYLTDVISNSLSFPEFQNPRDPIE